MTEEEIRNRVAALGKFDFRGAEALAKELLVEGRVPLRALQRLLIIPGSPELGKTETILGMLNELSILPWLVAARGLQGDSANPRAIPHSRHMRISGSKSFRCCAPCWGSGPRSGRLIWARSK